MADDIPIGDRIRNALSQYLGGMNALAPRTNAEAGNMLAYATPGYGNYLSGKDAVNAYNEGDWRGVGLGAFGALPLPFMGGIIKSIRAYHGSPHSFERFDMSKIGTGEGAQAYGHGLYFAESEPVAQSYRDMNASSRAALPKEVMALPDDMRRTVLTHADTNRDAASAARWAQNGSIGLRSMPVEDIASMIEGVRDAKRGRMYEVNINADPEHFLDWDKPLGEQSEVVKRAFQGENAATLGSDSYWNRLKQVSDALRQSREPGTPLNLTRRLPYGEVDSEIAKTLAGSGVPGVKYLDQGSRTAGTGTRNYVVFDDKLISIVKRYGIPGAIGLGLITPEMGRQMQEQGL